MARDRIASKAAIIEAIDDLKLQGLKPSVRNVADKIGGGSYTTIKKALAEIMPESKPHADVTEMPADLAEIGKRAVLEIYRAVQVAANVRISAAERDARGEIIAITQAKVEAELEIVRLEHDSEARITELESSHAASSEARDRAERAEGQVVAMRSELELARAEIQTLRIEAKTAVAEAAELRGKFTADYDRAKAEIERLREKLKSPSVKRQTTATDPIA